MNNVKKLRHGLSLCLLALVSLLSIGLTSGCGGSGNTTPAVLPSDTVSKLLFYFTLLDEKNNNSETAGVLNKGVLPKVSFFNFYSYDKNNKVIKSEEKVAKAASCELIVPNNTHYELVEMTDASGKVLQVGAFYLVGQIHSGSVITINNPAMVGDTATSLEKLSLTCSPSDGMIEFDQTLTCSVEATIAISKEIFPNTKSSLNDTTTYDGLPELVTYDATKECVWEASNTEILQDTTAADDSERSFKGIKAGLSQVSAYYLGNRDDSQAAVSQTVTVSAAKNLRLSYTEDKLKLSMPTVSNVSFLLSSEDGSLKQRFDNVPIDEHTSDNIFSYDMAITEDMTWCFVEFWDKDNKMVGISMLSLLGRVSIDKMNEFKDTTYYNKAEYEERFINAVCYSSINGSSPTLGDFEVKVNDSIVTQVMVSVDFSEAKDRTKVQGFNATNLATVSVSDPGVLVMKEQNNKGYVTITPAKAGGATISASIILCEVEKQTAPQTVTVTE